MRVKRPQWLCLCVAALFLSSPAIASPREELEQTRKEMEQSRARQADLSEQTRKLEAELKSLQEKLVQSAAAVQKSENELSVTEEKLRLLGDQLIEKNNALVEQRKYLASLVQAALALSRTPPEAMVMMPGDPLETMKAARVLKMTQDGIKQEAARLGLQLKELAGLKEKVTANRDELRRRQATLAEAYRLQEGELAGRKALWKKLGIEQQQEAEKLQQLAKKAEDLEGLVGTLAEERKSGYQVPEGTKGKLRSIASAKGHLRTPVAGQVVQWFGADGGHGDTSKGLLIATRSGAQVTAPYDGEVVFTGPFLNYGRMVILRHSDGFHSLLAGLGIINVGVGQFLIEGEPIGGMGSGEGKLYIELRKDNQPINPAAWIAGFKKKKEED